MKLRMSLKWRFLLIGVDMNVSFIGFIVGKGSLLCRVVIYNMVDLL